MSFVQFWCWESWINLCCLLFPCIVMLSRFKNLYSQTIQCLIPPVMDGHPFQIEQNIRLSLNFEPWKLMEPHLLVPNSKVEGVCFEEGSFGLLSTPSVPDFTPLSAYLCPQKSRNQLAFVCTSTPFSICSAVVDVYSEFLGFYIRHDVDSRKRVGVKKVKLSWPNKNGLNGGFEFRSQFCDFPQI